MKKKESHCSSIPASRSGPCNEHVCRVEQILPPSPWISCLLWTQCEERRGAPVAASAPRWQRFRPLLGGAAAEARLMRRFDEDVTVSGRRVFSH